MQEPSSGLSAKPRSRTAITGPLNDADPYYWAVALDRHARDEAWMLVAQVIGTVADAAALITLKDALRRVGRPFESLFPDNEPDVYAALMQVLARSTDEQRAALSDACTRYEAEAIGAYLK